MKVILIFVVLVLGGVSGNFYWHDRSNIVGDLSYVLNATALKVDTNIYAVWKHYGLLTYGLSTDNGVTWNTDWLHVVNNTVLLDGAKISYHLEHDQSTNSWLIIYSVSWSGALTYTVIARARADLLVWNFTRHFEHSYKLAFEDFGKKINDISSDQMGHWLISWLDGSSLYTSYSSNSFDWDAPLNCSQDVLLHRVVPTDENSWLIVYQTSDGIYVANSSQCSIGVQISNQSTNFIVSSDDGVILVILSNGQTFLSNNQGVTWDETFSISQSHALVFVGNQTWMLLSEGYTSFSYDHGVSWIHHNDINTPTTGVLLNDNRVIYSTDNAVILSHWSEFFDCMNICVIEPTQVILINQPQKIQGNLTILGTLELENGTLTIDGDLILNETSIITLSKESSRVDINGTFFPGGTLNITNIKDDREIFIYGKLAQTNFTAVHHLPCQHLEYATTSLRVAFDPSCSNDVTTEEEIHTWMIVTIVGGSTIAVTAAVVGTIFFRKKLFPHRDHVYADKLMIPKE